MNPPAVTLEFRASGALTISDLLVATLLCELRQHRYEQCAAASRANAGQTTDYGTPVWALVQEQTTKMAPPAPERSADEVWAAIR